MNATKKIYGSKSRREKEAQEFREKIILKDETDEILLLIKEKKKEIDIEHQNIATLFRESKGIKDRMGGRDWRFMGRVVFTKFLVM